LFERERKTVYTLNRWNSTTKAWRTFVHTCSGEGVGSGVWCPMKCSTKVGRGHNAQRVSLRSLCGFAPLSAPFNFCHSTRRWKPFFFFSLNHLSSSVHRASQ
jgi:hypothetical protein